MFDIVYFIKCVQEFYGYGNFICDMFGLICEVVELENFDDLVFKVLLEQMLLVWIKGFDVYIEELVKCFDCVFKFMYYQLKFL